MRHRGASRRVSGGTARRRSSLSVSVKERLDCIILYAVGAFGTTAFRLLIFFVTVMPVWLQVNRLRSGRRNGSARTSREEEPSPFRGATDKKVNKVDWISLGKGFDPALLQPDFERDRQTHRRTCSPMLHQRHPMRLSPGPSGRLFLRIVCNTVDHECNTRHWLGSGLVVPQNGV